MRFADAILTPESELGNLNGPLNPLQVLGVWLSGDFRVRAHRPRADVRAARGGRPGRRRRDGQLAVRAAPLGLAIYVVATVVGAAGLVAVGSPWVDGKALATASPAFVLAAMACAGALIERARRVEGAILALWSSPEGCWPPTRWPTRRCGCAPRDALVELEAIGERTAGQGPTLLTSFDPFAARHFLRRADAEEASGLRRRIVPLPTVRCCPRAKPPTSTASGFPTC